MDLMWLFLISVIIVFILLVLLIAFSTIFTTVVVNGWPTRYAQTKAKLNGKTVIVTGANAGIGKATALDLAQRGARVILACRNMTKGEEARRDIIDETGNENVVLMRLDVSDFDSVRAFVKTFLSKEDRLDVLVNNAGIYDGEQKNTKDGHNIVFGTNHLGPFLLTHLLLDILKKSAPSRIVNVASMAYREVSSWTKENEITENGVYPHLKDYPISKLANILHARQLSKVLTGAGVRTYSLHPGAVRTDIFNQTAIKYPRILLPLIQVVLTISGLATHAGAQTTIYCAVDESLETVSGRYYENVREARLKTDPANDDKLAEWLWDVSMEMCGLK